MGKYKRIYLTAGSTLIGLFVILTLVGVQITSDGDQTCQGTLEDPCVSYLTFTNPTAKSIYVYNSEDIKLDFSPEIKDYELYVKYYGKWLPMNFTRSTRLSNVPVNAKYNFVFPRYSTKEFKLVGYKNNPSDVIKWGMGVGDDYLDPYWLGPENFIIDGDTVYVNDSKIFLSATPHTSYGEDVVSKLISKVYTGDVTLAVGFAGDDYFLKGAYRQDYHNVTTDYNYTCNESFGYELIPEKRAWCYIDYVNGSKKVLFNHTFNSGNIQTKTVYWSETNEERWSNWNVDSKKVMFEHEGVDTWRVAKNIPIIKDKEYTVKFDFEYPRDNKPNAKYWICLMPSSYGNNISAANAADHLYCLDPWTGDPPSGGTHYYDFEEGTGSSIDDLWGLLNGTISSMVWNSNVPSFNVIGTGGSYSGYFSGTAYADLTAEVIDGTQNQYWSVSYWVKRNGTGYYRTGGNYNSNRGIEFGWKDDNDFWIGGKDNSDTYEAFIPTTTLSSSDTDWHLIVMGQDNYFPFFSLDGGAIEKSGTAIMNDASAWTAGNWRIGSNGLEGSPFKGYIDEDKMFNMSLNITEIENIYDYGTITAPDYVSNFSVSINSPVNNSYTYDHTPDFNFTVNGTETSYDCDLVINGTYYGFNVSSMNNTVTTITANASIVVGDYVFNITCTQNDTTNYSASVYFDIRDYVIAGTIKYSNLTLVNNSGEQTFIEIINQSNNASIAWTSANEVGAWSYDSVPMGVYGVHARTDTIISGGASNPWINVSQVNGWFT